MRPDGRGQTTDPELRARLRADPHRPEGRQVLVEDPTPHGGPVRAGPVSLPAVVDVGGASCRTLVYGQSRR